jgi:hypothetical protein
MSQSSSCADSDMGMPISLPELLSIMGALSVDDLKVVYNNAGNQLKYHATCAAAAVECDGQQSVSAVSAKKTAKKKGTYTYQGVEYSSRSEGMKAYHAIKKVGNLGCNFALAHSPLTGIFV